MCAPAIVQARPSGKESFGLCVVHAMNESHEFAHDVPVKPRWTERMLANQPARREYREVDVRRADGFGRAAQYGIDRRVRVIEAHRADGHEPREIVLVGRQIPVPRHYVEGWMAYFGDPEV